MTTTSSTLPLLVESLADLPAEAFAQAFSQALSRADLVELRLDRLPADTMSRVPPDVRGRVLATCRAGWEGGGWSGTEDARLAVLVSALDAGVGYVDVEWRAAFYATLLAKAPGRVVLSMHDFARVPDDLADTVAAMAAAGPAIVKIAVQASRSSDVLRCRAAGTAAGRTPIVLIAMGPRGVASRVLSARLGSRWTYAGAGVAPGQIDAATMRAVYRVGRVSPHAAVYGVAGRPIGHSLSPVLHNAACEALDLDAVYVPFEAQDIDDLLDTADGLGVLGLSVTAPFKEDALRRASDADDATRAIGAANTLTRTPDGWIATNTDVEGFLAPLRQRVGLAGARVAVLGAGGAARGVVTGLTQAGAQVTVHARRPAQASALAPLGAAIGPWPPAAGSWDVLVNTTPVGTSPTVDETPVPASSLGPGLVYDLVYNPADTRLLRDARAAGASTLGGLDMLVTQAALQFARWFDVPPPLDVMRAAVARHAPHLLASTESACPE
jgi:3-dehydroquinate dehydratase/shikimate dehydrogenase